LGDMPTPSASWRFFRPFLMARYPNHAPTIAAMAAGTPTPIPTPRAISSDLESPSVSPVLICNVDEGFALGGILVFLLDGEVKAILLMLDDEAEIVPKLVKAVDKNGDLGIELVGLRDNGIVVAVGMALL
jgi:hypothetical protein